jgi:hypothetical protein
MQLKLSAPAAQLMATPPHDADPLPSPVTETVNRSPEEQSIVHDKTAMALHEPLKTVVLAVAPGTARRKRSPIARIITLIFRNI